MYLLIRSSLLFSKLHYILFEVFLPLLHNTVHVQLAVLQLVEQLLVPAVVEIARLLADELSQFLIQL